MLVVTLLALSGCVQDMADQPKYEALEKSEFFDDHLASRKPVPGTVAQGQLQIDEHFHAGLIDGRPAETFPMPVTRETLERGRQRYDIFCSPCHDHAGYGEGIVVERGFPAPPSFHTDRLRGQPVGHFFDVITNGVGRMYDYAAQIPPEDRWKIVAYIRALQLSQHAPRAQLDEQDIRRLDANRGGI